MQNINLSQLKNFLKIKNFPAFFERYEIFVILAGVVIVFLLAGWIFYSKAYKTVNAPPSVSPSLPSIDKVLFDKTISELEQKKQPLPSEPIIDPFR